MKRLTTAIGFMVWAVLASGCTGTEALDLTPRSGAGGIDTPATALTAETVNRTQAPGLEGERVAAITTDARVRFAPVIGATQEALPPLTGGLSARAAQRGIVLAPEGDDATHVVKGYLSAINDGSQTTVIYVWDVLDPAGNRLHRIQGQQKAAGGEGAGWSAVTGQTMETIADRTIDELAVWLARPTG